jgi:phosphonopyruvate decarboxylase
MAMKPEDVLKVIAAARGNAICVPTMTTSPAWREIAPDDLSVGCVGFMGGASSLGLGLALARPERRVVVFDGDGSLLMQLGSLATIAGARPRNLVHLLFKNGVYHTSGSQEIPGGLTVDFVTMARGAGYRNRARQEEDPSSSSSRSRRSWCGCRTRRGGWRHRARSRGPPLGRGCSPGFR